MKYLLVGGLLTMVAIAPASAQTIAPAPSSPARTQSAPLVTHPVSSNPVPGSSRLAAPYTSEQLNSTLGILQANPKVATPAPSNSIESLIQRFSTSDRKPAAIDPIDFFKPPALDGGVKYRFKGQGTGNREQGTELTYTLYLPSRTRS